MNLEKKLSVEEMSCEHFIQYHSYFAKVKIVEINRTCFYFQIQYRQPVRVGDLALYKKIVKDLTEDF